MLFKGLSFLSFIILSSKRIPTVNRWHSEINFNSLSPLNYSNGRGSQDNYFAYSFLTHLKNHSKDNIKSYEQKVKNLFMV